MMLRINRWPMVFATLLLSLSAAPSFFRSVTPAAETEKGSEVSFRGAMLSAEQVSKERLRQLAAKGYTSVALVLSGEPAARRREDKACEQIQAMELELSYWIEVARCPELARQHPRWMASLQGHQDWRRLFDSPPTPGENEVVKNYPWVPILNREPFDGQLNRVKKMLADRPPARRLFLNDLQGAPSACGCGNQLCRWTSDYGDIRTSTPLGDDAAAMFVAAISDYLPNAEITPVWTTECEQHDGAADGHCAGVGCFKGICWRAYTKQLHAVAEKTQQIGVLLPYLAFERDLPVYGQPAGWILHATETFQTMPPQRGGQAIKSARLIAVLQGWDTDDRQIEQQLTVAGEAGVAGTLVAYAKIDQDWRPRLLSLD